MALSPHRRNKQFQHDLQRRYERGRGFDQNWQWQPGCVAATVQRIHGNQQWRFDIANAIAASNSIVSVNVNGGLAFSNATAFAVGGLSGNSNFGLTNTAGQSGHLERRQQERHRHLRWCDERSGGLVKVGQGTFTLTNSNTYTG